MFLTWTVHVFIVAYFLEHFHISQSKESKKSGTSDTFSLFTDWKKNKIPALCA